LWGAQKRALDLKTGPRNLEPDEILRSLETRNFGKKIHIVETCASTNDLVASLASDAPHGTVAIAEEQTRGRGRNRKPWYSPKGGIWITALLRPQTIEGLGALPLLAGVAIARALNSSLDVHSLVRWPNDVMLHDRKIAGAMIETRLRGNQPEYVLLGLGINANFHVEAFSELRETATTLLDILGFEVDRVRIICAVLNELERAYESLIRGNSFQLLEAIRQVDWSRGKRITVTATGKLIQGTFDGYLNLTNVRIISHDGSAVVIGTGEVISADYPCD
jgi:BirA family biotin operon repressor/biotin-[acetyl-CoA-carboxylase] ligase